MRNIVCELYGSHDSLMYTVDMKNSAPLPEGSEQEMYFGGLMEDMREKFQIIVEATRSIPRMQEQIDRIMGWEEKVNLIPVIFDEVGSLRQDLEVMKQALELIGKHDERIADLEARIQALEKKQHA